MKNLVYNTSFHNIFWNILFFCMKTRYSVRFLAIWIKLANCYKYTSKFYAFMHENNFMCHKTVIWKFWINLRYRNCLYLFVTLFLSQTTQKNIHDLPSKCWAGSIHNICSIKLLHFEALRLIMSPFFVLVFNALKY